MADDPASGPAPDPQGADESGAQALAYIRRHYGVPADAGRYVTVNGDHGVIVGGQNAHLLVDFGDGPIPCHPTWRMDYGDEVRVNACQTNITTPEGRAALDAIVDAVVEMDRGAPDEPPPDAIGQAAARYADHIAAETWPFESCPEFCSAPGQGGHPCPGCPLPRERAAFEAARLAAATVGATDEPTDDDLTELRRLLDAPPPKDNAISAIARRVLPGLLAEVERLRAAAPASEDEHGGT